ncbi:uncharacterized protein C5L36_0D06390 [Pichia kudriavzevii]|uniref:Uncharacterized protein n=1 Tax=Pichia kudriavzevii TaxID=4909 RepID=A0A2U9R979_PICKU|nr:uncharacterized protein C5L36_0D06390 [Pichia kudriavzevii]AWU77913.1 hypothetical protein C5L36_0D06390 [Pichia kudriavzevii]
MQFQKYLLPLGESLGHSQHYATCYLRIKIENSLTLKSLSETVSISNQILEKNTKLLKLGKFNSNYIIPNIHPCSPLTAPVPYHDLIKQMNDDGKDGDPSEQFYNAFIKNVKVYPKDLEIDSIFPTNFKFLASKVQTNDFHVSLLPILRFDNVDESSFLLSYFKNELSSFKTHSVDVHFNGDLQILPKYDYSKFFLSMVINNHQNTELYSLLNLVSRLREKSPFRGHVIGEVDSDIRIVNWKETLLHMTIGVNNIADSNFGMLELAYLNHFLSAVKTKALHVTGDVVLVVDGENILLN